LEDIVKLGERLTNFHNRFGRYFRTKTSNTSEYGLKYISGFLRMETDRNLANVGRKTEVSGQNLQHFVSNSARAAATQSGCQSQDQDGLETPDRVGKEIYRLCKCTVEPVIGIVNEREMLLMGT